MRKSAILSPAQWGLDVRSDSLLLHGLRLSDLAREYGTPLHVVNEPGLRATAGAFQEAVSRAYDGATRVHFPLKCNAVPGILSVLRDAGLSAEVMTEYELEAACDAGFKPEELIVNGPYKSERFLERCLTERVRLIVVDSLSELDTLVRVAHRVSTTVDVLLRVYPRVSPKGSNWLSGIGASLIPGVHTSSFGLDLWNGETALVLAQLSAQRLVRFKGFHFHIGTGIRDLRDFGKALRCLPRLIELAHASGLHISILDVGGGLASPTAREFSSLELLRYQSLGSLPHFTQVDELNSFDGYAAVIANAVQAAFAAKPLPTLLFEPGRAITSRNQLLLLSVTGRKRRSVREDWVTCDGGLSTVTMPTYYEYHEVFPCDDVDRDRDRRLTLLGPACFAGDVIYRNKMLPDLAIGETIAIMDSGAYFTSLESAFGYPRPAIVAVSDHCVRILRTRETLAQMSARDHHSNLQSTNDYAILHHA